MSFDRGKARKVLDDWYGMTEADVEYDWTELLDSLEKCAVPDPRITAIDSYLFSGVWDDADDMYSELRTIIGYG